MLLCAPRTEMRPVWLEWRVKGSRLWADSCLQDAGEMGSYWDGLSRGVSCSYRNPRAAAMLTIYGKGRYGHGVRVAEAKQLGGKKFQESRQEIFSQGLLSHSMGNPGPHIAHRSVIFPILPVFH